MKRAPLNRKKAMRRTGRIKRKGKKATISMKGNNQ